MRPGLRTGWTLGALLAVVSGAACSAPPDPPDESATEDDPTPAPDGSSASVVLGDEVVCAVPSGDDPLHFEDITTASGIAHTPDSPPFPDPPDGVTTSSDVELLGGMAAADLTGNGHLDLLFSDATGPLRLYEGDGELGFTLLDPAVTGLPTGGDSIVGVSPADFDGDGDLDLFLCVNGPNRLMVNGGGTWTDEAELRGVAGELHRSTSASWADFDLDGDLDVFVTNYGRGTVGPGDQTAPQPDVLWVQQADGTFTALDDLVPDGRDGYGFIGGWFDADDDGLLDLLVVNDIAISPEDDPPNLFLHNLGLDADGAPRLEPAPEAGLDVPMMGMGIAFGDFDGDGDLDVHVTDAGPTLLARNDSDLAFVDASLLLEELSSSEDADISWATRFLDHDADGDLELHTAYGHMASKGVGGGPNSTVNAVEQRDALWEWSDDEGFVDLAAAAGLDDPRSGRTSLAADFDRDGFAELVGWALSEGPRLLRPPCNDNRWLTVHLAMPDTRNPNAIGARVEARVDGELVATRAVGAGSEGVFSSDPAEVYLGLAQNDLVDLVVRWPDGSETTNLDVPTRREVWLSSP